MADTEISGSFGFAVLVMAIGFFVYGQTLAGVFGTFLLLTALGASILIGLIPFAGVFIQGYIDLNIVIPGILGFTGLWDTWLVTLIFVIVMIIGAILTGIISLAIVLRD